ERCRIPRVELTLCNVPGRIGARDTPQRRIQVPRPRARIPVRRIEGLAERHVKGNVRLHELAGCTRPAAPGRPYGLADCAATARRPQEHGQGRPPPYGHDASNPSNAEAKGRPHEAAVRPAKRTTVSSSVAPTKVPSSTFACRATASPIPPRT